MSTVLGIAGASRNATIALCDDGEVVAVCEQERLTRTRREGLRRGKLPLEATQTVLNLGRRTTADVSQYAVAETAVELPGDLPVARLDHHYGHAAAAFLTSRFSDAVVVVCDRHGESELTVWRADASGITRADFPWIGPGFATVYGMASEALGFAPEGDEHKLEALARVGGACEPPAVPLLSFREDRLEGSHRVRAAVAGLRESQIDGVAGAPQIAAAFQKRAGDVLIEVLREVKRRVGGRHLCLGGGLFFNSSFNTRVAESGLYDQTFVPINPGNAGVAIGAALAVSGKEARCLTALSPFLGPQYKTDAIKATLDNCKLSYDYIHNGQLVERTVSALASGKLVGWFQGRMEWGPRALGNRSILASPLAPYALDNLNVFLKRREPHRSYGVSICADDLHQYFRGPGASAYMEYEYEVIDSDLLRPLLPLGTSRLRVHTVPSAAGPFYELLKAFKDRTGVPILVNTSFNAFNEPIVCSPRDAVRVFYGTGLDMVVLGNFVLHK